MPGIPSSSPPPLWTHQLSLKMMPPTKGLELPRKVKGCLRWHPRGCAREKHTVFLVQVTRNVDSVSALDAKVPNYVWTEVILSPGPLPGTPEVSKINYLGLSYLCVTVSQLGGLTTRQHFSGIRPESADRLVVFVYLIAHRNFASKVEQEPLSFGGAGVPTHSRTSILLVSRSCSVFPLCKPTGIGHWNLITGAYPVNHESVITRIVYWNLR